jgi:hypothetical protein
MSYLKAEIVSSFRHAMSRSNPGTTETIKSLDLKVVISAPFGIVITFSES